MNIKHVTEFIQALLYNPHVLFSHLSTIGNIRLQTIDRAFINV